MNNNEYYLQHIRTFQNYQVTEFEKTIGQLKDNPTYYFTWNIETIIKSGYKKQFYQKLIDEADDNRDIRINIIYMIKFLQMLDENFHVSRSTNMFQMQEDIILIEARVELIDSLESLLKYK